MRQEHAFKFTFRKSVMQPEWLTQYTYNTLMFKPLPHLRSQPPAPSSLSSSRGAVADVQKDKDRLDQLVRLIDPLQMQSIVQNGQTHQPPLEPIVWELNFCL
jgi:hypothetical protein